MLLAEVAPISSTHNVSCEFSNREISPRPLERRVNLFGAAESEAWLEELRKNFITLSETDAIDSRSLIPASRRHWNRRGQGKPRLTYDADPVAFPTSFWISTFPLRKAPSSMAIRCVVTSPLTTADFFNSTRSEAVTAPSNLPWITTALALTFALTFPFGPTVRLWLFSSIFPSTLPSTYKSSDPDNSPLMTTDLPMWANSPDCGASMFGLHLVPSRSVRRE